MRLFSGLAKKGLVLYVVSRLLPRGVPRLPACALRASAGRVVFFSSSQDFRIQVGPYN